jgi:hypothetical protein
MPRNCHPQIRVWFQSAVFLGCILGKLKLENVTNLYGRELGASSIHGAGSGCTSPSSVMKSG